MKLSKKTNFLLLKAGVLLAAAVVVAALHISAARLKPPRIEPLSDTSLVVAATRFLKNVAEVTPLPDGPPGINKILDSSGAEIGYILDTRNIPGQVTGYNGPVPIALVLDSNGLVAGIEPMRNTETASYMDRVRRSGFLTPLTGKKPSAALEFNEVDTVSGATYTSRAMISSARTALTAAAGYDFKAAGTDPRAIFIQTLCSLTLLFAVISWLAPHKLRRGRTLLLVLDVTILGFLGGVMLSMALLGTCLTNGPNISRPILLSSAILAVLLPFITGRQFWCSYACPFGAASELMAKIPLKKFCPPSAARRIFRFAGRLFLIGIALVFLIDPTVELSVVEPFPAFSLSASPMLPLILAILFLAISMLIPKVWCRFLCPTGRVVNFFAIGGSFIKAIPAKHHSNKNPCENSTLE